MASKSRKLVFMCVLGLGAGSYFGVKSYDSHNLTINNKMSASEIMDSLRTKVLGTVKYNKERNLAGNEDALNIQCLSDEMQFVKIEQDVLLPFKNGLRNKNVSLLSSILTNDFFSHDFDSKLESKRTNLDGITQVEFSKAQNLFSKSDSLNNFKGLLNNYQNIEFAEIIGEKYSSAPSTRNSDREMDNVTVWARYDLRGTSVSNAKLQDRGLLKVKVRLDENLNWKAYKMEIVKREKLFTSKEFFSNITNASKIVEHVPSYLRREAIRRGGYAMAIGDYNNDESVDLFVATVAESVLLKGSKSETFSSDKQKAIQDKSLVKAAAFADFDNNGTDELLMVRFAPNESQSNNDRSDIQILNNDNGKFSLKKGVVNFNQKTAYAMPLALADFDGDNQLDFYVGFPGAKDFTTLEPAIQKQGLATQGVFYNQGGGSFKDDPLKTFANAHNGQDNDLSKIFPHAALAADYNNDGSPDLIVIDDRGNLSPVYENDGKGNFTFSSKKIGVGLSDYGMGAEVGDLNGDGRSDFLMSSVNFNSSKRIKESCEMNWSVKNLVTAGTSGLRMFEGNKNGTFTDVTVAKGLDFVGEGAGGVTLIDYNNDGHEDIYLVNGLWTGSENDQNQDISSYFVTATSLGMLEDDIKSELRNKQVEYRSVKGNDFKSLLFRADSQSAIMDILSFYRGDIHSGQKVSKEQAPSLAGAQRNRLFRNNGNGSYTEVGFMVGVDSIADGYMAATADFDKDGSMDLVLRNADPGYRKDQFAPVQVFKNNDVSDNNSVIISLKGTNSNSNAVGASLVAKVGSKKLVRQLIGNKGTVQSERLIHFGLSDSTKVDRLDIRWPSGKTQVLYNLKKGFHKIVEPEEVKAKKMAAIK